MHLRKKAVPTASHILSMRMNRVLVAWKKLTMWNIDPCNFNINTAGCLHIYFACEYFTFWLKTSTPFVFLLFVSLFCPIRWHSLRNLMNSIVLSISISCVCVCISYIFSNIAAFLLDQCVSALGKRLSMNCPGNVCTRKKKNTESILSLSSVEHLLGCCCFFFALRLSTFSHSQFSYQHFASKVS